MIVALGKGETDEYKDNLHKVGKIFLIFLLPENVNLLQEAETVTALTNHRSANIYKEKWEFFSQTKQKMKSKSE